MERKIINSKIVKNENEDYYINSCFICFVLNYYQTLCSFLSSYNTTRLSISYSQNSFLYEVFCFWLNIFFSFAEKLPQWVLIKYRESMFLQLLESLWTLQAGSQPVSQPGSNGILFSWNNYTSVFFCRQLLLLLLLHLDPSEYFLCFWYTHHTYRTYLYEKVQSYK